MSAPQTQRSFSDVLEDIVAKIQQIIRAEVRLAQEEKVRNTFNCRAQFEERPMTLLAVAFGGGVLASALLPSGSRRRGRDLVIAKVHRRETELVFLLRRGFRLRKRSANGNLQG
jgi:hypothetical protein